MAQRVDVDHSSHHPNQDLFKDQGYEGERIIPDFENADLDGLNTEEKRQYLDAMQLLEGTGFDGESMDNMVYRSAKRVALRTRSQQELGGVDFFGGILEGVRLTQGKMNIAINIDSQSVRPHISNDIIHALLNELVVLFFVKGRVPDLGLNRRQDQSMYPNSCADGLVLKVMLQCDYFMKAFFYQAGFFELDNVDQLNIDSLTHAKSSYEIKTAYEKAGVRWINRDRYYSKAVQKFGELRKVFIKKEFGRFPDKLALEIFGEQGLVYQMDDTVIFNPKCKILQHGKHKKDDVSESQEFEYWSDQGVSHIELMLANFGNDPKIRFYQELLKSISSLVVLLQTCKHYGLIPKIKSGLKLPAELKKVSRYDQIPPLACDMENNQRYELFGGAGITKQPIIPVNHVSAYDFGGHLQTEIELEVWDKSHPLWKLKEYSAHEEPS